jgi:ribosomal protein S18 acetylase RimI-like enzyme
MLISGVNDDPEVQRAVDIRPAAEISKMYVLAAHHGSGAATALMDAALAAAAEWGAGCVWLGVNQKNERAQQFYKRCGFTVNGTRSFRLGAHTESDYVMVRPLDAA